MNRQVIDMRGWQGPDPYKEFVFNPSLNSIYKFSLNSKIIEILVPFNFIFQSPLIAMFSYWLGSLGAREGVYSDPIEGECDS